MSDTEQGDEHRNEAEGDGTEGGAASQPEPTDAESMLPTVDDLIDAAPKKADIGDWSGVLLFSYARKGRAVNLEPPLRNLLSDAELEAKALTTARLLAAQSGDGLPSLVQLARGVGLSNPDDKIIAKTARIVADSWAAVHEEVIGTAPVDPLHCAKAEIGDPEPVRSSLLELTDAEQLLSDTPSDSRLWPYARDVAIALLWLAAEGGVAAGRVMDLLRRRVWVNAPKSTRTRSDAANLLDTEDWAALATVRRLAALRETDLERQVTSLRADLERTRERLQLQRERADRAVAQLQDERERWKETQAELLSESAREVEDARRDRDDARARVGELEEQLQAQAAHSDFDSEQLRTSMLQRARRDAQQLEEAMAALSKEQPKLHVVDDRLDRTLASLHRAIDELSEGRTA